MRPHSKQTDPNAVSLFFVAHDPEEQEAITELSQNGDLRVSSFGTAQVPLKIRGYDIYNDNGPVEAVRLCVETITGNVLDVTVMARPKDKADIQKMVNLHAQVTAGTFRFKGGMMYPYQSTYASNAGTWVGKATMFFEPVTTVTTTTTVVTTKPNPAKPAAPRPPAPSPVTAQAPGPQVAFATAFDRLVERLNDMIKAGQVASPTAIVLLALQHAQAVANHVDQANALAGMQNPSAIPPVASAVTPVAAPTVSAPAPVTTPSAPQAAPAEAPKKRRIVASGYEMPPRTEQHCENLSKSLKGRQFSLEHRKNMSIAAKARWARLRAMRRPMSTEGN